MPNALVLIGLNHRTAPIEVRERFDVPETQNDATLQEVKSIDGVDGVADPRRERTRVGAVGPLRGGEQAVQERGALVEIGVVPLEAGAVVVAHQCEADGTRVRPLQEVAHEHEVAE